MNLATWIDLNRFIDVPAKYRSCLTNNMHLCAAWLACLLGIAQPLISKFVNKNWKSICLIKKEVFLDQKYLFSVYKFYLPLNQSGYWVYFVSLMCSHIVTFGCSHIQLKFYRAELNSSFLLPLVSARSFVTSSSVFSASTGTSSGSSYRQIRKKL